MQVIEGTPNDKIAAINADVTRVQGDIQGIEVKDEESKVIASEMLSGIKIRFKRIEELRTFFVKPLNDQVKNINDMFRTPKDALEAAEKILKKKLIAYADEQERIRKEKEAAEVKAKAEAEAKAKAEAEAAARAAEEAAAKAAQADSPEGKAEAEEAAKKAEQAAQEAEVAAKVELDKKIATMETPKTTQTALGSTTTKKVWTFEITDPSKVPAQYLMVDEKKIRAAVKEGAREISGVRIFQETQIAAR